jgi:uncharacterized protein
VSAPLDLRGRWALVTGASGGIGAEFARRLAARGANVVLCARSGGAMREIASRLEAEHGVRTATVEADLSRHGAAPAAWDEAAAGREIDVLVNNAGSGLRGPLATLSADAQGAMVALNCAALVELTRLALPAMLERRRGAVVNVGSIVSYAPVPGMATYAATKAFVLSLTAALREECRGTGVRVLFVGPGPVPTGFQAAAGSALPRGGLGVLSADRVARSALAALDRDRGTVIPGGANRLGTALARLLPTAAVARAAAALDRRR